MPWILFSLLWFDIPAIVFWVKWLWYFSFGKFFSLDTLKLFWCQVKTSSSQPFKNYLKLFLFCFYIFLPLLLYLLLWYGFTVLQPNPKLPSAQRRSGGKIACYGHTWQLSESPYGKDTGPQWVSFSLHWLFCQCTLEVFLVFFSPIHSIRSGRAGIRQSYPLLPFFPSPHPEIPPCLLWQTLQPVALPLTQVASALGQRRWSLQMCFMAYLQHPVNVHPMPKNVRIGLVNALLIFVR